MNTLNSIAGWLPPKVRAAVYTVLAAAIAVAELWDLLPDKYTGKILATLSILGFGMAAVNATPAPTPPVLPPPDHGGVPENYPGEFPN